MNETVQQVKSLTADNLKQALWETLNDLRDGKIQPRNADAIAGQAREITRIVKVQMQVSIQNKQPVPQAVLEYTGK